MNMQSQQERGSRPRPDGTPKRISVAVKGLVLMCLATAMTLPAFIWLIRGGLCGPGNSTCSGPADMPLPALVLVWLSVPFGLVALGVLLHAERKIGSGEELRASNWLPLGFLLALGGTLIVAYIVFSLMGPALNGV